LAGGLTASFSPWLLARLAESLGSGWAPGTDAAGSLLADTGGGEQEREGVEGLRSVEEGSIDEKDGASTPYSARREQGRAAKGY
jgi:hypothetical protein